MVLSNTGLVGTQVAVALTVSVLHTSPVPFPVSCPVYSCVWACNCMQVSEAGVSSSEGSSQDGGEGAFLRPGRWSAGYHISMRAALPLEFDAREGEPSHHLGLES